MHISKYSNLNKSLNKVYIPLRAETTGIGALRWGADPTRKFTFAIQTCWYLKTQNVAVPTTQMPNFGFPPTQNPKSVEYSLSLVPSANFSLWPCRFHVVYTGFFCVRYPIRTLFSVEYGLNIPVKDFFFKKLIVLTISFLIFPFTQSSMCDLCPFWRWRVT